MLQASLPKKYDYVENNDWHANFVTGTRDQGTAWSCYAFGAIAAIETQLLIDLVPPPPFHDDNNNNDEKIRAHRGILDPKLLPIEIDLSERNLLADHSGTIKSLCVATPDSLTLQKIEDIGLIREDYALFTDADDYCAFEYDPGIAAPKSRYHLYPGFSGVRGVVDPQCLRAYSDYVDSFKEQIYFHGPIVAGVTWGQREMGERDEINDIRTVVGGGIDTFPFQSTIEHYVAVVGYDDDHENYIPSSQRCAEDDPCPEGQYCKRYDDMDKSFCITNCSSDADCPEDLRCSPTSKHCMRKLDSGAFLIKNSHGDGLIWVKYGTIKLGCQGYTIDGVMFDNDTVRYPWGYADSDEDGIPDGIDNCPGIKNFDQDYAEQYPENSEGPWEGWHKVDGVRGKLCDYALNIQAFADTDKDNIPDNVDNCVFKYNRYQCNERFNFNRDGYVNINMTKECHINSDTGKCDRKNNGNVCYSDYSYYEDHNRTDSNRTSIGRYFRREYQKYYDEMRSKHLLVDKYFDPYKYDNEDNDGFPNVDDRCKCLASDSNTRFSTIPDAPGDLCNNDIDGDGVLNINEFSFLKLLPDNVASDVDFDGVPVVPNQTICKDACNKWTITLKFTITSSRDRKAFVNNLGGSFVYITIIDNELSTFDATHFKEYCDDFCMLNDNCPDVSNPNQDDRNQNGTGDRCDKDPYFNFSEIKQNSAQLSSSSVMAFSYQDNFQISFQGIIGDVSAPKEQIVVKDDFSMGVCTCTPEEEAKFYDGYNGCTHGEGSPCRVYGLLSASATNLKREYRRPEEGHHFFTPLTDSFSIGDCSNTTPNLNQQICHLNAFYGSCNGLKKDGEDWFNLGTNMDRCENCDDKCLFRHIETSKTKNYYSIPRWNHLNENYYREVKSDDGKYEYTDPTNASIDYPVKIRFRAATNLRENTAKTAFLFDAKSYSDEVFPVRKLGTVAVYDKRKIPNTHELPAVITKNTYDEVVFLTKDVINNKINIFKSDQSFQNILAIETADIGVTNTPPLGLTAFSYLALKYLDKHEAYALVGGSINGTPNANVYITYKDADSWKWDMYPGMFNNLEVSSDLVSDKMAFLFNNEIILLTPVYDKTTETGGFLAYSLITKRWRVHAINYYGNDNALQTAGSFDTATPLYDQSTGRLYFFGGSYSSDGGTKISDKYIVINMLTDSLEVFPMSSGIGQRINMATAQNKITGDIYLIGGKGENQRFNEVWKLTPQDGKWYKVSGSIPSTVVINEKARAVVDGRNGTIHIIGGQGVANGNDLIRFDPTRSNADLMYKTMPWFPVYTVEVGKTFNGTYDAREASVINISVPDNLPAEGAYVSFDISGDTSSLQYKIRDSKGHPLNEQPVKSGGLISQTYHVDPGGSYQLEIVQGGSYNPEKTYAFSMTSYKTAKSNSAVGSYKYGSLLQSISDFEISGQYAYLLGGAGLDIVDISNPTKPRKVSRMPLLFTGNGLSVREGYAFIANGIFGLTVVDVKNPLNPKVVSNEWLPGTARDITVVGNRAYVAAGVFGVQTVDVSNPKDPKWVENDSAGDIISTSVAADNDLVTTSGMFGQIKFYRAKGNFKMHNFYSYNAGDLVKELMVQNERVSILKNSGKVNILNIGTDGKITNLGCFGDSQYILSRPYGKYVVKKNGNKLEIFGLVKT